MEQTGERQRSGAKHFELRAISHRDANAFIEGLHRHHKGTTTHKFSLACWDGNNLIGVATVNVPNGRELNDGLTVEVTRLCTDGTQNACSFLYGACARAAKALGYKKIITYILESESGGSLVASGWKLEDPCCGGRKWVRKTRPQLLDIEPTYPTCKKQRWSKEL